MFIGRKEEITELNSLLDSNNFEACLLLGRRRVGKSELLKNVIKNRSEKVLFLECKKTTLEMNLIYLSVEIAKFFNMSDFYFNTYEEMFDFLLNKFTEEKYILILDEFSFLLEDSKLSIESDLAKAINKYKTNTTAKIILCGSIVKLMEKLIDDSAPLFGRFTHIINLKPFNYFESSLFYPDYSDSEKILMYSVFGGIPYFNSLISPEKSAIENIIELLVKKDSIVEYEIKEMVLGETNKGNGLNAIISLIGRNIKKYSDIVSVLSKNSSFRPDYVLNRLLDLEILEKVAPINQKNNKKLTFYRFKDNLIHFYYRYIFPNSDKRNFLSDKDFFDIFIKEDLEKNYLPEKFEQISIEFLIHLNKNGMIKEKFYDIGTFFCNDQAMKVNRQFDVVTLSDKGYISYECKYSKNKLTEAVINEEINQTKNLEINFYKLGFISKEGFSDKILNNKIITYSLSEFYK